MTTKILIIDPLTLMGRELTRCIEDSPDLAVGVEYRHTSSDDEHQIAEIGATPALVPSLDDPDDLAGVGIVLVTSDRETERTGVLEELLIRHPEITVIDVGRLPRLAELTVPATATTARSGDRLHLRVAHPALVAAAEVLEALRPLDPDRGSVAAVDPVSIYGRDALDVLVHQAGRRMQGGDPEDAIDGYVLAFNQVAVSAVALAEEAAELLPGFPLAVTRTLNGCFHGHLAHLAFELADSVDDFEVRDALEAGQNVIVGDPPMGLELVADRDHVLVTQPQLSSDRRVVAMTAMVDGLRHGGALTATEILRSMTVH